MYHPATVTCDECGRLHEETNGWFTIHVKGHYDGYPFVGIVAYREGNETLPAVCGEECLHKFVSKKLGILHGKESIQT